MKNETVHARISSGLKSEVLGVLAQLGLSISDAINIYFRQISLNQGLPFDIKIPNKETLKIIKQSKNRKNIKTFSSIKQMRAYLES